MDSFQHLFEKSGGKPVSYRGDTIQLVDTFAVSKDDMLAVTIESYDKTFRQGLRIDFNGTLDVDGEKIKRAVILWSDTAPRQVPIRIIGDGGEIAIRNVWDTGNGVVHSWHSGAAMVVTKTGGIKQYRCNDGRINDDFNDIIFSIKLPARE